jgi:glycerol-3-phosphate dehydrogenase
MYDVIVIGAGSIGGSIARELMNYKLNVAILESSNDVSNGTTKANSAIIHAGFDAPYDSLKGQMNVLGNKMYDEFSRQLAIPFMRIGSLVIAHNDDEMETLKHLYDNGVKLGVPDMKIIGKEEVKALEPNLRDDVLGALYAPTAGIIEPWEIAIAAIENAIDNGCELFLSSEVTKISEIDNGFELTTKDGKSFKTRYIINAAGVYADKIYGMVTEEPEFSIKPRRGQYFLLDKTAGNFVNHVVFPTPTKMGKGTLITPTADGNLIVGPDSEDIDNKEALNTTRDRLEVVRELASHIADNIPYWENITTFSGLRAEPSTDDFIIEESKQVKNFINVAGIKSPGLSSVPAIAQRVVEILKDIEGMLVINQDFNPIREKRVVFHKLSRAEQTELIAKDPQYGRIICRCEMITEGEIVDSIKRNAGATTLNGVKRRVRPGAGRCQGGFCGPLVASIISRELGIAMEDVLQEDIGSNIILSETKEVGEA